VKDGIYLSETRSYLLNVNEELIIAYVTGSYLESMRWWITTNYAISPVDMVKTLIEQSINGPYIKRPYKRTFFKGLSYRGHFIFSSN
jgi:hypothetical protein